MLKNDGSSGSHLENTNANKGYVVVGCGVL